LHQQEIIMSNPGHGLVGKREQDFTSLLPLRATSYNALDLAKLAEDMKGPVDTVKDGPDPEENVLLPAGYTYFGQFIDHDLTFDSTSSLNPNDADDPSNVRTPRFDLDCLYGDGPDAQPFMYDIDAVKLLFQNNSIDPCADPTGFAARDLTRNCDGLAIIGDKRNDENSIVSQIQLAFIKYHNAVVDTLKQRDPKDWNTPHELFKSARNEVRWTYQRIIVEDFLPRIIDGAVLKNLQVSDSAVRAKNYALYTPDKRGNLPREFVAAAYRFGHSGVRTGYRMNSGENNRFDIFPGSDNATQKAGSESLLGFDPITNNQVIDNWERFFPYTLPGVYSESREEAAGTKPDGRMRLQFAYKIDTTMVDPLAVLPRAKIASETATKEAEAAIKPKTLPDPTVRPPRPSLALLNLLRGDSYRIQGGQAIAKALQAKGLPCKVLDSKQLAVRKPASEGKFRFETIAAELQHDTPLWFYILAEAQAPLVDHFGHSEFDEKALLNDIGAKTQLGWVGGRIVAEVFYGLLDADSESFVNAAPTQWQPMLGHGQPVIFRSLLKFADPTNA
jgi:Animal haem peroxidase